MPYRAPIDDIMQVLAGPLELEKHIADGTFKGLDPDTIRSILEEAGKFATEVLDPLNIPGDRTGSKLVDGKVVTPTGWAEAYSQFAYGGWAALSSPEEFGGQHLPSIIAMSASEMWSSANLSFNLGPMLTHGAVDALLAHGSDALRQAYLPRMVSGEWTGTMNLTEPQAGSDLGALKTRAEPQPDGTYKVFGTKIFITYGDHELTKNIIHLVLARTPTAPPGTRGISLFLVPKYLLNADGTPGKRNDVICASLEHKLGIHASPTCVMKYGEQGGAVGYLVGEENKGLNIMFIMMNQARLGVAMQGVALAERATQRALDYAHDRRQGRAVGAPAGEMSPIIQHADIKRTLMTMRAMTQAARTICMMTALQSDISHRAATPEAREQGAKLTALLTPVAKAFATDIGCEVASLGVQIHGGMGFIEETGAAQYYRDSRILPIYEGTNGIQAIDLVTRKLPMDGGKVLADYITGLAQSVEEVRSANIPGFGKTADRLKAAIAALAAASRYLGAELQKNPDGALAGATPYLRLFGVTAGGTYLAKTALASSRAGAPKAAADVALARFFAENVAVAAPGLADSVTEGGASALALAV